MTLISSDNADIVLLRDESRYAPGLVPENVPTAGTLPTWQSHLPRVSYREEGIHRWDRLSALPPPLTWST